MVFTATLKTRAASAVSINRSCTATPSSCTQLVQRSSHALAQILGRIFRGQPGYVERTLLRHGVRCDLDSESEPTERIASADHLGLALGSGGIFRPFNCSVNSRSKSCSNDYSKGYSDRQVISGKTKNSPDCDAHRDADCDTEACAKAEPFFAVSVKNVFYLLVHFRFSYRATNNVSHLSVSRLSDVDSC